MKTIILSFDDGRRDFYTRAFPILQKYGLPATLNVVTDFVENPSNYSNFASGENLPVSATELIECQNAGIEIACHGHRHQNNAHDIIENIAHLSSMGLTFSNGIGFASPGSEITEANKYEQGVGQLVENGILSYIRSGIQIRREGLVYSGLSWIDSHLHSPLLFRYLNRGNIIFHANQKAKIIPSVVIYSYTTLKQVLSYIEHIPDNSIIVLMFHSILSKKDLGWGIDKYYWPITNFDNLCNYLNNHKNINVSKTLDLVIKD